MTRSVRCFESTSSQTNPYMARNLLILLLLVVTIVLGTSLVRVENQRYALWLGMCPNMRQSLAALAANDQDAFDCTKTVQTRTAWWWHLYYAITDNG